LPDSSDSTTIIQPAIPDADMTPLERLLLTQTFSASADGDGVYFYSEEGPVDFFALSRVEIDAALAASNGTAGTVATFVAERLSRVAPEEAGDLGGLFF
jgi:hypothetical protein